MSKPYERMNGVANLVFIAGLVIMTVAVFAGAIENFSWQGALMTVGVAAVVWGVILGALAREKLWKDK